jgi:chromosome segregation protein
VLVSEPEVGLAAIGYLKQGGGGRSAFVPIETRAAVPETVAPTASAPTFEGEGGSSSWMSPAWDETPRGKIEVEDRTELVSAALAAPVAGEGVLGRMADMVTFADGYEGVGKRLLGRTVVVDQLDRALALHARGVKDRLVTLEGDLVDEDGVVAGGSREAQGAGVLAQKREIRDLEEIVGKLEHDLSEAMARLVTAKTELKQVQKALEGLRTQVHEGDIAIMGHEKDETRVRSELERHRDRLGQLGNEQLELEHRLRAIELDETTARDRKQHAIDRLAELERNQLDFISQVSTHRDQLEALSATLTEARIRAAQLGEKRAAAEAAALRLQRTDAELAARASRLEHEIEDSVRRAAELRTGCDALATELADIRAQRETQLADLETGRAAYDQRLAALTEVELAARELRTTADKLSAELGQLELRVGQIAMHRGNVEDSTYERYQVEVPAILYDYHQRPSVSDVEEARLGELKDLIDRMGTDINLTAIEEFAEVSQRFEFLSAQKIDLERAVDQLQRAIDKINKTSRKLFKDTFHSVNETFKKVYPRLFRGGQAYLSLSGGEGVDLLEAGVEIMAQPPGKKNSTVEQLSGGEKALTAVALVFSIFLIKPSPFCILDEVDAPLDEANVDRYNEIVREMTDRSQFIVITHNKRTMEAADTLYGVTMQEPGVSKLVSVNLAKLGSKTPPPSPPAAGESSAVAV